MNVPLYASCCTVLLYISRYCTIRFKILSLFFMFASCWEPPWEILPMTKVMRREPDRQRWIRPQGTPLNLLEHLPQNQNLSVLLFCAFHQLF